jgi:hypothetical protein
MRSGSELVLKRETKLILAEIRRLDGSGAGSGSAPFLFVYLIVRVCTIGRYIFNAEQLSERKISRRTFQMVKFSPRTIKSGKFFHLYSIQVRIQSCFEEIVNMFRGIFWLFQLASKLKNFSSEKYIRHMVPSFPLKPIQTFKNTSNHTYGKTPVSYSSLILKLTA